jgi:hypothetical protein
MMSPATLAIAVADTPLTPPPFRPHRHWDVPDFTGLPAGNDFTPLSWGSDTFYPTAEAYDRLKERLPLVPEERRYPKERLAPKPKEEHRDEEAAALGDEELAELVIELSVLQHDLKTYPDPDPIRLADIADALRDYKWELKARFKELPEGEEIAGCDSWKDFQSAIKDGFPFNNDLPIAEDFHHDDYVTVSLTPADTPNKCPHTPPEPLLGASDYVWAITNPADYARLTKLCLLVRGGVFADPIFFPVIPKTTAAKTKEGKERFAANRDAACKKQKALFEEGRALLKDAGFNHHSESVSQKTDTRQACKLCGSSCFADVGKTGRYLSCRDCGRKRLAGSRANAQREPRESHEDYDGYREPTAEMVYLEWANRRKRRKLTKAEFVDALAEEGRLGVLYDPRKLQYALRSYLCLCVGWLPRDVAKILYVSEPAIKQTTKRLYETHRKLRLKLPTDADFSVPSPSYLKQLERLSGVFALAGEDSIILKIKKKLLEGEGIAESSVPQEKYIEEGGNGFELPWTRFQSPAATASPCAGLPLGTGGVGLRGSYRNIWHAQKVDLVAQAGMKTLAGE